MTNHRSWIRIFTALAAMALSAPAFASDTTATDPGSRGQAVEVKQAAGTRKGAEQGHAEHASCVCAGLQAPLVPDHGG